MAASGIKLSRRHRRWFYISFSILFFSGLAWLVFHYWVPKTYQMELEGPPFESWALKIHGAAAMVVLVILGTLMPVHMKRAWKANLNKKNGVSLIVINLLLIVTGYGLYYVGHEGLRMVSHWSHIALGILVPVFIAWHIILGRKSVKLLKHLKSIEKHK